MIVPSSPLNYNVKKDLRPFPFMLFSIDVRIKTDNLELRQIYI